MPDFFTYPILNSPYFAPTRHWYLDDGRPNNEVVSRRRSSELLTALPRSSAAAGRSQTPDMLDREGLSTDGTEINPSTIVNELRSEIEGWRRLPNPEQWKVSPTTQVLLRHWRALQRDDSVEIRPFFCQLEAVETAIWLAEVAPELGPRGRKFTDRLKVANNLALTPDGERPSAAMPDLLRIAFKLATGAGKTTVMAMLIAWQSINAVRTPSSKRFSNAFLIVTPGITIKDRLRVLQPNDPGNAYERMGLVPRDMFGDLGKAKIVITNYHAFKRRETFEAANGTRSALMGHGDRLSTLESEGQMLQRAMGDLMRYKNVVVVNDEAHHCYRERPVSEEKKLTREEAAERLSAILKA